MPTYARALGAKVGRSVDLHSIPPVTGMLTLGSGCSVEPEVDLSGHWLDGDVLHIGRIKVGAGARVGTRSTLAPGAVVGRDAEVAPGSAVIGSVTKGEYWTGSPAEPVGRTRGPWSESRPDHKPRWVVAYAGIAMLISLLPDRRRPGRAGRRRSRACATRPRSGDAALVLLAFLPLVGPGRPGRARSADRRARPTARPRVCRPGAYPIHSLRAWQAWATMQAARRGADLAVPALLERAHPDVAAAPRRSRRPPRRGLDGAADPEADQHQRRGLPRRRHPARQLRARRRLAAGGAHQDRQARVRRQLRHDRAGTQGAQAVPRRRALGGAAPQEGQGRVVLAGQPAGAPASADRRRRRQPHLRPAAPAAHRPRRWSSAAGCSR